MNNCVQRALEKTFISQCDFIFLMKEQQINNVDLFLQPSSIIFTRGANNSDHNCKCMSR